MIKKLFIVWFLSLQLLLAAQSNYHDSLEPVTIQLKWKHAFQFAGYYAAIEKGFYADEGLDVTLKERNPNTSYIQSVLDGDAEYGVSDSSLVVARLEKKPVVLVAQILQYSPLVLIAHKDTGITTPYDMIGKRVMYSVNSTGDTPFKALILKTLGSFKNIKITEFTNYQDFIDHKVDVTSAYATSQPYWLKKQGVEVNIIDPKSYGIDFYGDNLFTTQKEVQEHPDRVKKMKRATLKGWKYALSHQDELIDIILQKYAPQAQKDALEFEARGIYQMISPDLIDLGSYRKKKYENVVTIYYDLGLVKERNIPNDFFYHDRKILHLTQEEKRWMKQHPSIKVGAGPDWAPFDFVNTDGKYNGIANDYLNLISQKTGLKFDIKVNKWSENLQKMKEKKIDLLHAIYYTDERAKYMKFTKPYFQMLDYFFVRDDLHVKTLKDLDGKRVAMPKGYAHGAILAKEFPLIKIVTVDTFSEAIEAVLENKADILFDTYASLSYALKQNGIKTIIPFKAYRGGARAKLHMATHKDNPLLTSILDKGLALITDAEKETIYNKWLPNTPQNAIKLTQKEEAWLANNPSVTFAGDPNWLPFEAFDKNGKYIGIVADYLHNIEKIVPLMFKPIQTKNWSQTIIHAQKGDIDVISDDIHSPPLQKHYKPIPAYITSPIVIVMKSTHGFVDDIQDIHDKKIALISEYGFNNKIKKAYPNQHFVMEENADIALKSLSRGKIDAVLLTMPKASYLLSTQGYTDLKIVGKTSINLSLTLFVHKSKPELYSIIQKSVKELSNTKSLEILGKWQKVEFAHKTDYTLLYQIAGLLGVFLLGSFYWNRKLAKEIEKRKKVQHALSLAKEEAERANLAKSEFLANMSHEIRTPMNSVLGFSELLEKQITDPVQKDYLDSIRRGGQALLDIINDILDLSKIEAGKLEIVYESVDIKKLISEMEALFSVKLIQKNLHFKLDIDPTIPQSLLLDSTRVRQILFNLIGNAIKFTHSGTISLRVKKSAEDVEKSKVDLQFIVEDTGIGISKSYLPKLFDAFDQQRGQDQQKYGGTGLGLAICKKLAHAMHGSIDVESIEGKGSKFTVTLRDIAVSSVKESTTVKEEKAKEWLFDPATIMIVDDIADNRKLVSASLLAYEFNIMEAKNGKEALEKLNSIKVDMILMDIKMPVMDGYEATKIIKNDAKLKTIPVVALTASVMGKDLKKITAYHFDGYLRKPVSQDALYKELGKFLPHKSLDLETEKEVYHDSYIDLPEAIKLLESVYKQKWEESKDKGDFSRIKKFANDLQSLADKHHIQKLATYAKTLQHNCDSFDIDKVDFMMHSYPTLIEQLKELT